ncbi:hypothetical protein [Nocardia farcinica]|uniref:Head-to-tail adaptor n=1 Tax=Nocardia farcinica (strain IFM 10152) TaxID=247156 RepID=Q5YSS1_NOCFA|nr:hypothetical protein [Nocardia farcinica]BAD58770.1 hypothetical protein NFA_39220 [Nocardia farcinica IFM 10152]
MRVYAQPDDLADWLHPDDLPDDAEGARLIRYASPLVAKATVCDRYEVDPAGLPTEPEVIEAMRDATCAHVAEWVKAGIDPAGGVVGREIGIASQSADGGSVVYADSVDAADIARSLTRLSDAAVQILRAAGLASTRPYKW